MPILSIFKFLLFLLFFLYLPGKMLLGRFRIKIDDFLVKIGLSTAVGLVLLTLLSIIIRSFSLSFGYLWLIPMVTFGYIILNIKNADYKYQKFRPEYFLVLVVLVLGVVTQNLTLFRGGWKTAEGLIFPSLHDTMWNISLSAELFHHFPPENPAIAGVLLKNNHYFYPLFLVATRSLSGIDIFDLYFRLGPILVSLLFGIAIYSICSLFTKKISFRALAIFLGYFSGNLAYLVPLFLGPSFDWKGNTFFSDQPFDQLINPYSVLGFVLLLFGIYCVSEIQKLKNLFGYSLSGALLLGSIYGFKSFGGIIAVLSLSAVFTLQVIFTRRLNLLLVTILTFSLFSAVFFLTTDPRSASLIWAPGWLLTQMMTDKDKLNLPRYGDLEAFYVSNGKILGLWKTKIIELFIYLLGNIGTRIAGLMYLGTLCFRKNNDKRITVWFMSVATVIAILIPLLFNLRNSTFNIIQFTPYSLVLLAIASTLFLEKAYDFSGSHRKKIWGIIIIVTFMAFSIPVNVKNIVSKFDSPKDLISYDEINGLEYLRDNTAISDIVLIDPLQFGNDPIYTAGLSERRVYLASPGYAVQTGLNPKIQEQAISDFFKSGNTAFLDNNKITDIYLLKSNLKEYHLGAAEKIGWKTVFEDNGVIIWERPK